MNADGVEMRCGVCACADMTELRAGLRSGVEIVSVSGIAAFIAVSGGRAACKGACTVAANCADAAACAKRSACERVSACKSKRRRGCHRA